MSSERWNRLWSIFHEALELEPGARHGYLAGACADDDALLIEAQSLIAAHDRPAPLLDRPPDASMSDAVPEIGSSIGRWRVVSPIGRGGMAQVFLVERSDGEYAAKAALKLIDPALVRPELIDRFLRERQILARLSHPTIARLIDGGHADDGRPYLVMEYVDGIAIDRWAARHRGEWTRIVPVLCAICEAVDFAHRQLIVHRDLKPGNVLVDANGHPHLLDFGIAKSLGDHEPGARAEPTDASALTPRYASPEQLEGGGGGTAGDIYALGVLMYEVLSGAPPYQADAPNWPALAQRLREQTLVPLRTMAQQQGIARLPVELDWIAARAMHPDPDQRYHSAAQMSDDLEAIATHRPVMASPGNVGYLARKFLRRHWSKVLVAAAFAVLAVMFLFRLNAEAGRTAEALAESERERERVARVAAFLADLFRMADTTQSGGRVVPAREILDRGRAQLAAHADLPASSRIVLLNSLGQVYTNMGLYTDASAMFKEAKGLTGPADARMGVEIRGNLGAVLLRQGEGKEAREVLTEALALAESDPSIDRQSTALVEERLGTALLELGEPESSRQYLERAFKARQLLPTADPRRAETAIRLGSWHWHAGDLDRAQGFYRQALESRRAEEPNNLPELARTIDANAGLLAARNRNEEAVRLYREALAIRRKVLGNDHPLVAASLTNLGAAADESGDDAESEAALREAIDIHVRNRSADSPALARTLNNLGNVRLQARGFVEAETLFQRALVIHRTAYGGDAVQTVEPLNNLGLVALGREDFAVAIDRFTEALAIQERHLGHEHVRLAFVLTNIGRTHWMRGDDPIARAPLERALKLRVRDLGLDAPLVSDTRYWLGWLACSVGDRAQGITHFRQSLAIRAANDGEDHARTRSARMALAICLFDATPNRTAEAKDLLRRSMPVAADELPTRIRMAWLRVSEHSDR